MKIAIGPHKYNPSTGKFVPMKRGAQNGVARTLTKVRRPSTFRRTQKRADFSYKKRAPQEVKFFDTEIANDSFTTTWAGGEMEDGTVLSISAVA